MSTKTNPQKMKLRLLAGKKTALTAKRSNQTMRARKAAVAPKRRKAVSPF